MTTSLLVLELGPWCKPSGPILKIQPIGMFHFELGQFLHPHVKWAYCKLVMQKLQILPGKKDRLDLVRRFKIFTNVDQDMIIIYQYGNGIKHIKKC